MDIRFLFAWDSNMQLGRGSKIADKDDKHLPEVCKKIASSIEGKLGNNDKRSLKKDQYVFHIQKQGEMLFICVANEGAKLRICYGLLENVAENGELEVDKKSCTKFLTTQLKAFNDPGSDEIEKCKVQIDDIKNVMIDNLDKIFNNIAKMEEIDAKVDELETEGIDFSRSATSIRRSVLRRNIIIGAIIFGIVVAVIVGFVIAIVVLVVIIEAAKGDPSP